MIYVGIDIGDGDTAASACYWSNGSPVVDQLKLDGMNFAIPSFLSQDKAKGTVLIGKNAICRPAVGDSSELSVNFKYAPSSMEEPEWNVFSKRVICFVNTLLADSAPLKKLWASDESEFALCFGHPTTWTDRDVELYLGALRKTDVFCKTDEFFGRKGVKVSLTSCKESHAALLNLVHRDLGKKKPKQMAGQENDIVRWIPDGKYLVTIDWGSSTTDITSMENRGGKLNLIKDSESGNMSLGARYLDRAIYEAVVRRLKDEDRRQLEVLLVDNPQEQPRLVAFCRFAKEAYFNATAPMRETGSFMVLAVRYFPIDEIFPAHCQEIMAEAVNAPLPEFDGRSWLDECRRLLEQVLKFSENRGCPPAAIYLTGGASKMDFVFEQTTALFPDTRVVVDPFPSVCIANGLAIMPYKLDEAKAFLAAVDKFLEDEVPTTVRAKMSVLADLVARDLSDRACKLAREKAIAWREGRILTLKGMEQKIGEGISEVLKSSEVQEAVKAIVGRFYREDLMRTVNARFQDICRMHNIRPRTLGCSGAIIGVGNEPVMESGAGTAVGDEIMDTVTTVVVLSVISVLGVILLSLGGIISVPIAAAIGLAVVNALVATIATLGVGSLILIPIAALVTWAVLNEGGLALQRELPKVDLPVWVRKAVISQEKLASIVIGQARSVGSKIAEAIKSDKSFRDDVANEIVSSLRGQYSQGAQDLALHIYD